MPSRKFNNSFQRLHLWLLIIVFLLGIFFRFANIESRVFWVDEVATSVRVSGYTMAEVTADLQAKGIVDVTDLLEYQFLTERGISDTWQALIKSPEHAPLYFLLTRLAADTWGHSLVGMRALSAIFSLFIFPALYWLLWELFCHPLVGIIGMMLMSVSPFYVAYAQEARPYSLWTVTILLMSASFIRGIKSRRWQNWTLYIICLTLALYTSLLSIFIVASQGVYLFLSGWKNKQKLITNYLISNAIALFLFSPWLYVIATQMQTLQSNTTWMRTSIDITALIATWIGTVLLIFGDLPLSPDANAVQMAIVVIIILFGILSTVATIYYWAKLQLIFKKLITYTVIITICLSAIILIAFGKYIAIDSVTLIGAIVAILILSLVSYALYFVIKNIPSQKWLFLVCLLLASPIPLLISDLLFNGQSSGAPRYLIPTQLAIQISVANTFATNMISSPKKPLKQQKIWSIILVLFLTLGVFSCTRNLNISPIYLKSRSVNNYAIASKINNLSKPLVIVEPPLVNDILSLGHNLSSQVKVKVTKNDESEFFKTSGSFSHFVLLKPSDRLKNNLLKSKKFRLQKIYQPTLFTAKQISLDLWLLEVLPDRSTMDNE